MKTIEQIGVKALKEHLIKNWMTHDGMWFYHCLQAFGIEEANRLNKAAIKSLAAIELKRARTLFGLDKDSVDTFDDLKDIIDAAFTVSKGDFMTFTYTFPEKNILRWEWVGQDCFAYQGMQRLGVIDRYECGVLYRVLCWIENTGVRYSASQEVEGCLMHTGGKCTGEVMFFFP
jgi:Family of unknown function (DUF6125)